MSKVATISTNSVVKTKKGHNLEKCANFREFRGADQKKGGFYRKICEKAVLAHTF